MKKLNNSAAKIKELKEKIADRSNFGTKPVMAASSKPAPELAISITDSSAPDTNEDAENQVVVADNDDDSVVIAKTPKPQPVVPATFELETCTTLMFIDLVGNRNEILLDRRILLYSDLQREIAKRTPKTQKMYVIQDSKGNFPTLLSFYVCWSFVEGKAITARYFIDGEDTTLIRIKEIRIHSYPPGLIKLTPKWEFEGYHEATTQKSVALNKGDSFSDIVDLDDWENMS